MTTTDTTSKITAEEFVESLTGYEEAAIRQHFDGDISDLLEHRPTMGLRALVFTDVHRRGETNVQQSKKTAMEMRLGDVMAHFLDDDEFEPDPMDPETDAGKGDEQPS